MDEILDVVDKDDRVIARKPRREIHRQGLMHRAVHLWVFNARGDVFLQQRSKTKEHHPGVWESSASGHVDSGETYEQAVLREAREEIGLGLTALPKILYRVSPSPETANEHIRVFTCHSEGPFSLDPVEVGGGRWFTNEEVARLLAEKPKDFSPVFRFLWGSPVRGR